MLIMPRYPCTIDLAALAASEEGRALTAPMVRVQQKHAAEPQDAADLDAILENCPAGR
jgi:hypothetical protein